MKLNHLQIMDTIDKNYEVVIDEPPVKRKKPKAYRLASNFPVGELNAQQIRDRLLNPNKRIKGPIAPWAPISEQA
jgi:hypothetical protein